MDKTFIYGMSVAGSNFTDRTQETKRLKMNFENGVNTILISPRRMGKTSLVKKTMEMTDKQVVTAVYMDIYDCRSEYDFLNRFASSIMKQTARQSNQIIDNIKRFLVRLSPRIAFSPTPDSEVSIALGITPKEYTPEEILNLPEVIAQEKGIHIVICIDEFQQIGELPDSLSVQKRMRGIWQHQQNVSYCLFGSKKHLMTNLFQSKSMPFFQFGEMMMLHPIPTKDWVKFIVERFKRNGKSLPERLAEKICSTVNNHSSYVQQLAWNLFAETNGCATDEDFDNAVEALIAQCSGLFVQQTISLTSYQLNFLRALCAGIHTGFGTKEVNDRFSLGSKSNIARIKAALTEKEMIEETTEGVFLTDVVFEIWFKRELGSSPL